MIKNTRQIVNEGAFKLRYNIVATVADISTSRAKDLYDRITALLDLDKRQEAHSLITELNRLYGRRVATIHNIVPTVGLTVLAMGISGNATGLATIEANYAAIGTSTGTPALGNTALGTEQFRKAITSLSYNAGHAYFSTFFTATDFTTTGAMGNIKEFAIFINGTTGSGSGTLWSRSLLNAPTGVSKTNIQPLTLDYDVEFANI
jgi:hypothetical protein